MQKKNFLESVKIPFAGSLAVHGLVLFSLGTFILSKAKPEMRIIPIEVIQMAEEKAPEPEAPVTSLPPEVVRAALPSLTPPSVEEEEPPPEPIKKIEKKEPVVKPEKKKEPQPVKEAIEEKEMESAMDSLPAETVATAHHEEHSDHAEHAVAQAVAPRSTGTATQELDEMRIFKNLVRQKIERAKFYPSAARRRGYEGAVGVRFTIQSDGGVEDVEVVAPCHCDILNKAACSAVKEGAPYSPMPDSLKGPIDMEINVAYRLN